MLLKCLASCCLHLPCATLAPVKNKPDAMSSDTKHKDSSGILLKCGTARLVNCTHCLEWAHCRQDAAQSYPEVIQADHKVELNNTPDRSADLSYSPYQHRPWLYFPVSVGQLGSEWSKFPRFQPANTRSLCRRPCACQFFVNLQIHPPTLYITVH